jgi:ABC-type lipoprotein release transport system permease subunit
MAVALGVFAGIFFLAFANGMVNDRIQTIIRTEMSHIQIHQPGFQDNNQLSLYFSGADSILEKVRQMPHVTAASKRIVIQSMVASAETGTGVKITGIDPADEQKVTSLKSKIIEGNYFDGSGRNPVIISERLAQKLKVHLKNKLVITVQDVNKNISGGAFRIVGIYRTNNMLYDEANIFVRNTDIARLAGLTDNDAHEIAVLLDANENTDVATVSLSKAFLLFDVKNWMVLSPEAGYMVSAMSQYSFIFMVIILLALCFGIVNTMLMVILERVHELGMLMAIGMNRRRIFVMIMLETIFLSFTGGMAGILLGYAASEYYARAGIDLYFWKDAFAEIGYPSLIYTYIDLKTMLTTTAMVILTGVLSALYPANKALKLNPSESIRT